MNLILKIANVHQKLIQEHLASQPDREVCGLIGGFWRGNVAVAKQVIRIENVSATPAITYFMNPQMQYDAMLAFDKQGWQVVGIYHSHPQGTTAPSPTDIKEASYTDAVYVIGLPTGELQAWQIIRGEVKPVEIEITD